MSDQFDGVGGSYVVDPETGERVLVERTAEISEKAELQQPEPVLKGKKNAATD